MKNNNPVTEYIIKACVILIIIVIGIPSRVINYIMYHLSWKTNRPTAILVLSILFASQLQLNNVQAQSLKHFAYEYQLGLESTFGIKSFQISSNIAEINNLPVVEEGGTLGVIIGARALRAKIRQGYYYSSSSTAYTVDEIRSSGVINVYPLFNTKSKLQPYMTVSLDRNVFKMYGFYGPNNDLSKRNYSIAQAPYLGKISSLQASVGAGVEYKIAKASHFVNFFGEAKMSKPVSAKSDNSFFKGTTFSNQMTVSIGVGFGFYR